MSSQLLCEIQPQDLKSEIDTSWVRGTIVTDGLFALKNLASCRHLAKNLRFCSWAHTSENTVKILENYVRLFSF